MLAHAKSIGLTLVFVGGLAAPSSAQGVVSGAGVGGFGSYPGFGVNTGYYTVNGGFGNYGLPGAYPTYNGYGLTGYGPAANLNGFYNPVPSTFQPIPQTYNNLGGVMGAIRQTGNPDSWQNSNLGTSRRRRSR